MKSTILIVFLLTASTTFSYAQLNEQDVRQRLDLIHSGKIEQVRTEISSLLNQLPNDPGVKYLEAYVTENGDQAMKKYQTFVDMYPQNEWADDALYKVYQYYYAVGLYKTADTKLTQLNEQYPNSIFAKREVKQPVKAESLSVVKTEQVPVTDVKKEEIKEVVTPSVLSGNFVVQIGVYSQETKAQQQAQEMTSIVGRQAIVFPKQSAGKTVYAVAFDGFVDDQSARAFGGELTTKFKLDWYVVKR